MRLLFINSHPIQYFAPLYRSLSKRDDIDLEVLYCSKHGLSEDEDKEFGVKIKWDIPLLEGYKYRFFENRASNPGVTSFWGLNNRGLIKYLRKAPKSIVIVHGWGFFTHYMAIIFGKLAGHTICLRGDSNVVDEIRVSGWKAKVRQLRFRYLLFPFVDYFLYVGQKNRAFYEYFGAKAEQLCFTPYAVDNDRFRSSYERLSGEKKALRRRLGFPEDKLIILYSGKYVARKRPLDLMEAFRLSPNHKNGCLVFMGEGEMRPQMEAYIKEHGLEAQVFLTGFINQSKLPEYYTAADIFVMCSEWEPWGLSTNEAMNFNLSVLLSDVTGAADDLVVEGKNGYVFKTGSIEDFSEKIDQLLSMPREALQKMGEESAERIKAYSFEGIEAGLRSLSPQT